MPESHALTPLFVDDHLVVYDKPAGLASVPGRGPEKQECLVRQVRETYPDVLIVHRLDRDTSGVLLFARTPLALRACSRQFERRLVRKTYVALVDGIPAANAGRIDWPVRKDVIERDPPRYCVDLEHGRSAVTEWRVVEQSDRQSRLELQPLTGRSHQLRVHLKHLGHPILGDPIYASPEVRDRTPRLCLHATELIIAHPISDLPLVFRAGCPF